MGAQNLGDASIAERQESLTVLEGKPDAIQRAGLESVETAQSEGRIDGALKTQKREQVVAAKTHKDHLEDPRLKAERRFASKRRGTLRVR